MTKKENNIQLTGRSEMDTKVLLFSVRDFCSMVMMKCIQSEQEQNIDSIFIELELFADGSIGVMIKDKYSPYHVLDGFMLHEFARK